MYLDYNRVRAYFTLHNVSRSCVSKLMGSFRITTAVHVSPLSKLPQADLHLPKDLGGMEHGFPSFQANPGWTLRIQCILGYKVSSRLCGLPIGEALYIGSMIGFQGMTKRSVNLILL